MAKGSKNPPRRISPSQTPEGFFAGMWHTVRAVLIASMNRGLFLPAALFFLLLLLIWKTPSEFVPEIWKGMVNVCLFGFLLSALLATGWIWNVWYLRRIHHNEIARISNEKTRLQEDIHRQRMNSSDNLS